MSLTYSTYVAQLANLMVQDTSDANFVTFLPGCIDYAEQRCYADLDLQNTTVRNTGTLIANTRTFTIPAPSSGYYIAIQGINVITPQGATTATGTRNNVNPAALKIVDFLYPYEQAQETPSVPALYAMVDDTTIVMGPPPDVAYQVEIIGMIRPPALSASNTTTLLTTYFPQLMIAASMIFATAYQRDFGAQSDNPQSSASWENQYKILLNSAETEEVRKKLNMTYGAGQKAAT